VRRSVEAWVRRMWRDEAGWPGRIASWTLLPAEAAYRMAVALRNRLYEVGVLRTERPPIPVVSVGNVVVGGTGKTPVAAWLVGSLERSGAAPALVARGYGEDELELHRAWNPDAPVEADPDRVAAVARATARGARAAVLDDGFQHRRLGRSLDLVVVAAEQRPEVRCLPRGPYREGLRALARADAVVVTRRSATAEEVEAWLRRIRAAGAPGVPVARVDLVPDGWATLGGGPAEAPEGEVLAVTAIGRPEAFAALLGAELGREPELLAFPDHHAYDAADVERIVRAAGPRTVVTTEKDAVKLRAFERTLPPARVLPLRVVEGEGCDALHALVHEVVAEAIRPDGGGSW